MLEGFSACYSHLLTTLIKNLDESLEYNMIDGYNLYLHDTQLELRNLKWDVND